MKLIIGLVMWTLQLIYLVSVAILKTIGVVFSATKGHVNENTSRGKTFVKAYYYLEVLESGAVDSPADANRIASSLFEAYSDPEVDNRIIKRAMAYAKQNHNGDQLPTIEEAREKGFRVSSENATQQAS